MAKNITCKLQSRFFEYIDIRNVKDKEIIYEDLKAVFKSQISEEIIDRIKNTIDDMNNYDNKKTFLEKIFKIEKDTIDISLLEQMESSRKNRTDKTEALSIIKKELYTITTYDGFEKQVSDKEGFLTNDNRVTIDGGSYDITEISESSTHEMSYLISKLLGFKQEDIMFAEDSTSKKFIISPQKLPRASEQQIQKEESLCDKKSIWLYLENILSQFDEKKKFEYIRMIFLDIITNQNFRILRNGTGVLESDEKQNDYYVLNGKTLKKDFLVESLFENYYDVISDISDLIFDNDEEIISFIEDLVKNNNVDESYFKNIKENLKRVCEKRKFKIWLQELDENHKGDYSEDRVANNEQFKYYLDILKKSLGVKHQILAKSGYASILTIVLGIIACGFFIAYLMLMK